MDAIVKKILDEVKKKKPAPVYFLQGEEVFYIDLISSFIEANVLTESEKSFNQVALYLNPEFLAPHELLPLAFPTSWGNVWHWIIWQQRLFLFHKEQLD